MNGAASVDPLNLTIFKSFNPFSSRYFLVSTGNSVATFISSVISSMEFMLDSSGAARTSFVCPNLKSSNSTTSDSLSLIKSTPVIPISATPSFTNSGMSDALANITSMSSLNVFEINFLLFLSINPKPAFSSMLIDGSLILPFDGTAILIFIISTQIFYLILYY